MPAILTDAFLATAKFLLTVVPLFFVGVVLAQLFVELRWLDKLAWLARPLTRFGHLHPECAGTFVVAILSPTAAHSMLARYYEEGRISRTELIIAAIVNALPGYVAQGRSILPVLISLLGAAGAAYYGLVLLADLVKSVALLAAGALLLPRKEEEAGADGAPSGARRPALRQALLNALKSAKKSVPRVLKTMVPVTCAVFVLLGLGVFERAAKHIGAVSRHLPVPAEALPIVAARLASPIGAYTIAGSLLAQGVLGGKEVVMALMAGTLLATVPNIRYLAPYYFGIFGPGIGLQLVLVSTSLRVLVFAAVIGVVTLLL